MEGDGNGWSAAPDGRQVWGRFGAAGLFLVAANPESGTPELMMQHRAVWTNEGGTWALPGGARDSHETAVDAAIRESVEEASLDPALIDVHEALVTAGPFDADPARPDLPGGWTYTTVLATTTTGGRIPLEPDEESLELRWVPLDGVEKLPLLTAFRQAFPMLRERAHRLN